MRSEKQIWILGAIGSVVVHLVLLFLFALGLRLPTAAMTKIPPPPEPEITVVMATSVEPPAAKKEETPPPVAEPPKPKPKKLDHYIRTTQNEEAKEAPKNPTFESDRNTVAGARNAPAEKGDPNMPTTKGVDQPTLELADREYKEGELKHDSAPVPNQPVAKASPPPTPPTPQVKPQPPQPKKPTQEIAKKEDAPAEKILQEAKQAVDEKGELPKPKMADTPSKADALPEMKAPAEEPLIPRAIPMPSTPTLRQPTLDLPPPLPSVAHPEKGAFMPQTRVARMKGTISNRAHDDMVDAASTPTGRYMQKVMSAIEQRWQRHCKDQADFTAPGKMRLHFYVNKNGKPEDIRFVFSEANAVCVDFTLSPISSFTSSSVPFIAPPCCLRPCLPLSPKVYPMPGVSYAAAARSCTSSWRAPSPR